MNIPKDRLILVYGTPDEHPMLEVIYDGPSWFTAYWDGIDEAYCINGGDWMGPFIKPIKWGELPSTDLTSEYFDGMKE